MIPDLSGKQFGSWTVLHRDSVPKKSAAAFWACRCICGQKSSVSGSNLRIGRSKQCVNCAGRKYQGHKGRFGDEAYFELVKRNSIIEAKKYGHKPICTPVKELVKLSHGISSCEICGIQITDLKCNLHTDHDHTTGHFRGFICNGCNRCLGGAKDKVSTLQKAINYLGGKR